MLINIIKLDHFYFFITYKMSDPYEEIKRIMRYKIEKWSEETTKLGYYDFKGRIQAYNFTFKQDPNYYFDGEDCGPYYNYYEELVEKRTRHEHDLAKNTAISHAKNNNMVKFNVKMKTKAQLFKLVEMKRHLPKLTEDDINEIYEVYTTEWKRHNQQSQQQSQQTLLKQPEQQRQMTYQNHKKAVIEYIRDKVNYYANKKSLTQLFNLVDLKQYLPSLTEDDRNEIYEQYRTEWSQRNQQRLAQEAEHEAEKQRELNDKKKLEKQRRKDTSYSSTVPQTFTIPYFFKTARKRNLFAQENPGLTTANETIIPDKKLKPLKEKYMRPNFARDPYTWEMDHLQYHEQVTYLFFINVNTRYLYAFPVSTKTSVETYDTFNKFLNAERQFDHIVSSVRGDGDKGFQNLPRQFNNINFYFQSSKFTYHNKNVDAVMRTLRNALGPNSNHLWNGHSDHDRIIQELVRQYNNTWHRAINMTPYEMHTDVDKEWSYIREKTEVLNDAKFRQTIDGLHSFIPGDRVMVHLDFGKTNLIFEKRRRVFDRTATFVKYENGNGCVELDEPIHNWQIIEVPIFYISKLGTKKLNQF
ncbi:MAG: hypothetical protein R3Y24_17640 [Eubacteriales bacterium]